MAKKTESEYVKVQKLANTSARKIQKMINEANEKTLKFNADEAKKQRKFNREEATTAREFNADEAQKARDWQTEMSNTSHQREVADLKAAGLNPVLSAGSGAQSYTTSSASAQAASGSAASGSAESGASAMANIMANMMSSLTGLRQTQLSTESQLRAAQISASATRYAADQNRAAAQYAADTSYRTAMDRPQDGVASLIDKYFGEGLAYAAEKMIDRLKTGVDYVYKPGYGLVQLSNKATETMWSIYKKFGIDKKITDFWDFGCKNKDTINSSLNLLYRGLILRQYPAIQMIQKMEDLYKKNHSSYRDRDYK